MPRKPETRGGERRRPRGATPPGPASTGMSSSGNRASAHDAHARASTRPHRRWVISRTSRSSDSAVPEHSTTKSAGPAAPCQSRSSSIAGGLTTRRYTTPKTVAATAVAAAPQAKSTWSARVRPAAYRAAATGWPSPATKATNRTEVNSAVAWPTSVCSSTRAAISQNSAPDRACTPAVSTSAAEPVRRWRWPEARRRRPCSIAGEATGGGVRPSGVCRAPPRGGTGLQGPRMTRGDHLSGRAAARPAAHRRQPRAGHRRARVGRRVGAADPAGPRRHGLRRHLRRVRADARRRRASASSRGTTAATATRSTPRSTTGRPTCATR